MNLENEKTLCSFIFIWYSTDIKSRQTIFHNSAHIKLYEKPNCGNWIFLFTWTSYITGLSCINMYLLIFFFHIFVLFSKSRPLARSEIIVLDYFVNGTLVSKLDENEKLHLNFSKNVTNLKGKKVRWCCDI